MVGRSCGRICTPPGRSRPRLEVVYVGCGGMGVAWPGTVIVCRSGGGRSSGADCDHCSRWGRMRGLGVHFAGGRGCVGGGRRGLSSSSGICFFRRLRHCACWSSVNVGRFGLVTVSRIAYLFWGAVFLRKSLTCRCDCLSVMVPLRQLITGSARWSQSRPSIIMSSPMLVTANRIGMRRVPVSTLRRTICVMAPCLFGEPSAFVTCLGCLNLIVLSLWFFTTAGLMQLVDAPLSMSAFAPNFSPP